jgi:hypothetical protein
VARGLEDALRGHQVVAEVRREGVAEAAADAGLAGEVEDAVAAGDERGQVGGVEVLLDQREARVLAQAGEVRLLVGAGVVVREGVEPQDAVTALEQRLAQVRADEARGARDEVGAAVGRLGVLRAHAVSILRCGLVRRWSGR